MSNLQLCIFSVGDDAEYYAALNIVDATQEAHIQTGVPFEEIRDSIGIVGDGVLKELKFTVDDDGNHLDSDERPTFYDKLKEANQGNDRKAFLFACEDV